MPAHGPTVPRRPQLRHAAALAALVALAGCQGELPPPVARPLPVPDGVAPLLEPGPLSSRTASYRIDARYDPAARRIEATQTLTWRNDGDEPVARLPLHLYLNAFKNEDSVFLRESRGQHRGARMAEDGWGWIEITRALVAGDDLTGSLRMPGPDETVRELPLPAPVAPGDSIEVELAFEAQLPRVFARTGTAGAFTMAGQWFPKIAARSEGAWQAEPFHLMSEFFAGFGRYEVTLRVPATHLVAATGVLVDARAGDDGTHVLTYRADDVHDFAWMADPYMEELVATADGGAGEVAVHVYHRPRQRSLAERHLVAAVAALEAYGRVYRPYPYAALRVIVPPPAAEAGAGGMEYPTLVTTATGAPFVPRGVRAPEHVTVHEIGHQWFQGMLASNEVDAAWLDEGVTEYSNAVVLEELYGPGAAIVDHAGLRLGLLDALRIGAPIGELPDPVATRSHRFADFASYAGATYAKTALALATLEHVHGTERFRGAMRAYAERFAFRHPTEADLVATLESELGAELDWFLEPALHALGAADLRVRSVDCARATPPAGVFGRGSERRLEEPEPDPSAPWRCEVTVANLGVVPVPVDVEIATADGHRERRRWDDRGDGPRWHRFSIERGSPVVEVVVDPDDRVLLNVSGPERSWRRDPDPGAARRAGVLGQAATQVLMQAVGL